MADNRMAANWFPPAHSWKWPGCQDLWKILLMLFHSNQPHETMVWKLREVAQFKNFQLTEKLRTARDGGGCMFLLPTVSRASFLVQEATHTTMRLDNDTPQSHHQKDPFVMLHRALISPLPSCLLRSYLSSYCAPQEGQKDKPQTYFPDSSETPCRYDKTQHDQRP